MRTAGVSLTAVCRWQARFMEEGIAGLLRDKTLRPGTPRLPEDVIDRRRSTSSLTAAATIVSYERTIRQAKKASG